MSVKKVALSKIKKNPKNPRVIKDEKFDSLMKAIRDFPDMIKVRPVIVDENNVILGGNMRYEAFKTLGLKDIYISVLTQEMTQETQEKTGKTYQQIIDEFVIKDNLDFGQWDWDVLANEWNTNELIDFGMDSWNFGTSAALLDFTDEENATESTEVKMAKVTDDGYVRYEIIIKEEDKKEMVAKLTLVKEKHGLNTGQAIIFVINNHKI